ncbi:hypothetical protein CspeluHIS016_0208030 [Cutaneotrichosporon spelunceum]|uniref:Uncharacterized protein n=1 Tax=Cutaneotrichosporon spelunceum TaxID=1672016 RepID=A0AAD3YBB5_9TREE|nr:hypothetical protein CspeluHIS016_0208030 [Cutaneotrichosporon spelunceum]
MSCDVITAQLALGSILVTVPDSRRLQLGPRSQLDLPPPLDMPEPSYGSTNASSAEQGNAEPSHVEQGNSSYDDNDEYISADVYRATMRLVRLQMSIPLSVLIALGTLIVCGYFVNPSIREISRLNPTLLTPKPEMVFGFTALLFLLQMGLCLLLAAASSEWTKNTLIKGLGMRLAVVNWLTAAWAVTWTLSLFKTAEVIIIVQAIIILSIHFTLQSYPASFAHPLNAVFVHTTINMMLALTLGLLWMSGGFVAQDWVIEKRKDAGKWKWQAVGVVAGTHSIVALWELFMRQYVLAIAMEYQILSLLLSSPEVYPPIGDNVIIRPPAFNITLIVLLCVHPLACVAGWALKGYREREVRIALQEEAEAANARARRSEAEARARSPTPAPPSTSAKASVSASAPASTEGSAAADASDAPISSKTKKKKTKPEEQPLLEE